MRTFRKSLSILVGALFITALNLTLNFLFIPYQFTRMKIHTVETETFQDLILGSSHGSAAIDPAVLTEETGRSAFNAAAGGQYPMDNYYLLRDACRSHAPQRVIYEYDPAYWVADSSFNRNARYQMDVMERSPVRDEYRLKLCFSGDLRFVLMPWFLYRDTFAGWRNTVSVKRSEAYRNYEAGPFSNSYQTCRETGFTAIHGDGRKDMVIPSLAFSADNERLVGRNNAYFEKLAAFCRDNGMELVVVTTPVPEQTLAGNRDFYEAGHLLMEEMAGRYGFAFLDYVCPDASGAGAAPAAASEPASAGAEPGPSEDFHAGDGWEAAAAHFSSQEAFADGEGHMYEEAAEVFSRVLGKDLARLAGQ